MITLSRTTDKLQAFLSSAATTTNPTCTVVFYITSAQQKADTSVYPRDRQYTVLSGATETDICDAPDQQNKTKHIEYINVYNADTTNVTVTVCIDDNTTNRIQRKQILLPGQSLCYEHERGWYVEDSESTISLLTLGTEIVTTSGTSHDFTDIPSWVQRVMITLIGVSTNGNSVPIIQLGDSGGLETTGYLGAASSTDATPASANFTTGFGLADAWSAATVFHGILTLALQDQGAPSTSWVCAGVGAASNAAFTSATAGRRTLDGALTTIRLTTVNGTDAFDAGQVNILYE